ncbi:MAG: hypothetical protein N3G22_01870 [Candidatus Micrarchaeota archaeon]|nr:hypothetical protein [Candidatus Micrarchaeota archaeon]
MNAQRRVHFHFSFGYHATQEDFRKAKNALEKFRPNVYAMEEPTLSRAERADALPKISKTIQLARRDILLRRQILDGVRSSTTPDMEEFHVEQMAYAMDRRPPLAVFPLEAHDAQSVEKHNRLRNESGAQKQDAIQAIYMGETEKALRLLLSSQIKLIKTFFERDLSIVENMRSYGEDLLQVLPSLGRFNPLRVFVRLGHLHTAVYFQAKRKYANNPSITISREMDEAKLHTYNVEEWLQRALLFRKPFNYDWLLRVLLMNILQYEISLREGQSRLFYFIKESSKKALSVPSKLLAGIFERNSRKNSKLQFQDWARQIASEVEKNQ